MGEKRCVPMSPRRPFMSSLGELDNWIITHAVALS